MTLSTAASAVLLAYAMFPGTATDRAGGLHGGISALRWDEGRRELVGLSDRGPGDGTVPYQPRLQRYGVTLGSGTLTLELRETVLLRDEQDRAFSGLIVTTSPRLDSEGLAFAAGGGYWVSDEYGPSVLRFDATGRAVERLAVPAEYADRGDNQGFEGLCLSPDGRTLTAVLQSSLTKEGGRDGAYARLAVWSAPFGRSPARSHLVPRLAKTGFNACVALSSTEYLLLERDGGSEFKTALRARLRPDGRVERGSSLDLLAPLAAAGLADVPPKFESIEPGPLVDGRPTLWVAVDNDFKAEQPTMVFLLGLR